MDSEMQVLSDAIFECLRKDPDGLEASQELRFALVHSTEWKRRRDGEVVTERRPHIIGLDDEAEKFIAMSPFLGLRIPVGFVMHDGRWTEGLRFKELPISTAAHMIADLSRELVSFKARCDIDDGFNDD